MIVNGWTNVLPLSHMAHAFPLPMSTFPLPNGTGTIPTIGVGTALSERHEVGNACPNTGSMYEASSISDSRFSGRLLPL